MAGFATQTSFAGIRTSLDHPGFAYQPTSGYVGDDHFVVTFNVTDLAVSSLSGTVHVDVHVYDTK